MTDRSQDIIWGITKRLNCHKTKWNGKHWTYSPFSSNGMLNAGQAGNTLGITVRKDSTAKNFKRTFTMTAKHAGKNGIAKRLYGSQSNPSTTVQDIGRDVHHAAKIIQKQRFLGDNAKKQALRRLAKLARSTRSACKGCSKTQ